MPYAGSTKEVSANLLGAVCVGQTSKESIMKIKKLKKVKSTYEEFIEDPAQKKLLEQEYQDLLLSEIKIAVSRKDQASVSKLAEELRKFGKKLPIFAILSIVNIY
jgi:hypothetical protein